MEHLRAVLLAATASSLSASSVHGFRQASDSLSTWIAAEIPAALQGVLNDIGPDGLKSHPAKPGIIVESLPQLLRIVLNPH